MNIKLVSSLSGILMLGLGARGAAPESGGEQNLPLTEVILYSSGVGYFHRDGTVQGSENITFNFKTDDINDLLKSMVVQDFDGGKISRVTYDSRDPLTKTLKSFAIDLTTNPTLAGLLTQVRGEKVEVTWPNQVTGVILGIESKRQVIDEKKEMEIQFLNLVTSDGLQSIPMAQIQKIKLLNENLNKELQQALQVIAGAHDTQKKRVGFAFEGEGKRKVAIAYVAATPVWKTSYRLVLDEKNEALLQGWAIVENTTDDDWNNIQLSLVSGRPISFTMDLYQPLYATRPVVQPELYSSLKPQAYGAAMDQLREQEEPQLGLELRALAASSAAPAPSLRTERYSEKKAELMGRNANLGFITGKGVEATASGLQTGELFQYKINAPVTLARQKSALLPILNEKVQAEKVSIYNASVQAVHPLNGARLKNSTDLHLMQGPMTVFDGGTYAGDAKIEDLASKQERLISYALDLKTEVEAVNTSSEPEILSVKIRNGILTSSRKARETRVYNLSNRESKRKKILVEHPFRADWTLVMPKTPSERSRDYYRFAVDLDGSQKSKLEVIEEKNLMEQISLATYASDSIAFLLRDRNVSAETKSALEKLVKYRDQLAETERDIARLTQQISEISQEQTRIRENMTRLSQTSDLYRRYVTKFDEQETAIENSRQKIKSLQDLEAQQKNELSNYIQNLKVG